MVKLSLLPLGFKMASEVAKEDTLGHVMSSPATTINATDTLGLAAEMMVKRDIGSVVVLEGNNPVGIVTERDITKQVIQGNDALKKPVKQAMSKPLVTGSPNMSVQQAVELMLKEKIRRLPVLDGKNLAGMVTMTDLMRWVLRVSYEPNIPKHIKAILEVR
jgi:CBS domain-containing protein